MRTCNRCPLGKCGKGPVWGDGDPSSPYWLIGEAPGAQEDEHGTPFIGKAGVELSENYLRRNGLDRDLFYITNLVKCRPPKNRDPKPEEVAACRYHLEQELKNDPAIIAALGRFSATELLGRPAEIALHHGIPLRSNGRIVMPIYHPALGLHSTTMMVQIAKDFQALTQVIRGELSPEDLVDPIPNPIYAELKTKPRSLLLPTQRVIAVDTESIRDRVWSVQFAFRPGEAWFVRAHNTEIVNYLKTWLENPEILTVLHNAQHDLPMLAQLGIVPARWTCTMLMANLLQDVPKGLKALAYRLCHMQMKSYSELVDPITEARTIAYLTEVMKWKWPKPPKEKVLENGEWREKQPWAMHTVAKSVLNSFAKGTCAGNELYKRWHDNSNRHTVEALLGKLQAATLADVDFEIAKYYGCRDADATLRIYPYLAAQIALRKLAGPLERDCRIVPMVSDMEKHGMPVGEAGLEVLKRLGERYHIRKLEVIEEIKGLIGYRINPCSKDQVADLLFGKKRLKAKIRTKVHDSTASEILEEMQERYPGEPTIPLILKYRELDKMESTFVGGVTKNCLKWPDRRCRSHISMITVLTGRFAAKRPNLLAFPQPDRSPEGGPLRSAFIAEAGKVLLSGDYSQIELRVLADQSQEPTMMEVFATGGDIHKQMAAEVFKVPYDLVTETQRYEVKVVNFGIPYGITAAGLYKQLGPKGRTKKECEKFIADWFERFSKVAGYMEKIKTQARRYRYVEDLLGRQRLIPEVLSAHQFVREAGLRQACNAPIQMGAQSIMKEAMAQLVPFYKMLQEHGYHIWPLLQIHDDLLWEVDEDIVPWVLPVIKDIMENCLNNIGFKFSVPLIVDFKMGKSWGNMEKIWA